jgi:hypothetical protein
MTPRWKNCCCWSRMRSPSGRLGSPFWRLKFSTAGWVVFFFVIAFRMFSIAEAADLADVKPALLKLWLETGKFTPSIVGKSDQVLIGWKTVYSFTEENIPRLVTFAKSQQPEPVRAPKPAKPTNGFVDDGTQTDFTVSQIATMWHLSTDTIQRMFQDEPGVVALGDKNPRGKRKRVTLRIPRDVMLRVKKFRSNRK